jgi:DNA replication factor GINS
MPESTLDYLKRQLDLEAASPSLVPLPNDFYSKLASYSQKLRRGSGSGTSEAIVRLIGVQQRMVQSLARDLLSLRAKKAAQQSALSQLLPEERYVCSAQERFKKRFETFVEAVSSGQPSFVEFAHKSESERSVTVRFTKHVNELVGFDLRRYGPFEPEDVASIPAASADVLVAGGDAVEVYTREEA